YNYLTEFVDAPPDDEQVQQFDSQIPAESQILYYDDLGATLLRTVNKTWDGDVNLLATEQTVLGTTGLTSETDHFWQGFGPLTQIWLENEADECDYGSGAKGALLRKTTTQYAAFGTTPIFPGGQSTIFDRPSSVTVSGSGGQAAQTTYVYDG